MIEGGRNPAWFGRLHRGVAGEWREPLRMLVCAVAAYAATIALHLPEGLWAVLTALIVSRPYKGGTLQAGADRLVGTAGGAAAGMLAAFGKLWQVPFGLLMLAALIPALLLVAWKEGYRTAPIAAIIVLAAGASGNSPMGAALLRLAEIGIGGLAAAAVSWLLLPRSSLQHGAALGASLLGEIATTMRRSVALQADTNETEKTRERMRRIVGGLQQAGRAGRWDGQGRDGSLLARQMTRIYADALYADRLIARAAAAKNPCVEEAWFPGLVENVAQAADAAAARLARRPLPEASPGTSATSRAKRDSTSISTTIAARQADAIEFALRMLLHDMDAIGRGDGEGKRQPA